MPPRAPPGGHCPQTPFNAALATQASYRKIMQYFAQFYPDSDNPGGYSAVFPDLPGCQTCGGDLDESMAMAMDALTSFLEAAIADGEKLPRPSDFETAKARAREYYRELDIPVRKDALYLLVPADLEIHSSSSVQSA